jgi:hypothetical protein
LHAFHGGAVDLLLLHGELEELLQRPEAVGVPIVRGERRATRCERSKSRWSALMSFTLAFVTADLGTLRLLETHRVR